MNLEKSEHEGLEGLEGLTKDKKASKVIWRPDLLVVKSSSNSYFVTFLLNLRDRSFPGYSKIKIAAAITVVQRPCLSPTADCVMFAVRTILLEMR